MSQMFLVKEASGLFMAEYSSGNKKDPDHVVGWCWGGPDDYYKKAETAPLHPIEDVKIIIEASKKYGTGKYRDRIPVHCVISVTVNGDGQRKIGNKMSVKDFISQFMTT